MTSARSPEGVQIENCRIQLSDVEDAVKAVGAMLEALREKSRDKVRMTCDSCQNESGELVEALRKGWSDVYHHEGRFYGYCPECIQNDEPIVRPTVESESLKFCCDNPTLEWNGDPDTPGVACANCHFIVADSGSLVAYPEAELPKPRERQQTLFALS
jgi:hypothetical protein